MTCIGRMRTAARPSDRSRRASGIGDTDADARAMLRALRDRIDPETGTIAGTLIELARLAEMDPAVAKRALKALSKRGLIRWIKPAAGV